MSSYTLLATLALLLFVGLSTSLSPQFTYKDAWLKDIQWGNNSEVAFMVEDKLFLRSRDEGLTWVDQATIMKIPDIRKVKHMFRDKIDDKKFMFIDEKKTLGWMTNDAGVTYTSIPIPGSEDDYSYDFVELHPVLTGVAALRKCKNSANSCTFYITNDMGLNWATVKGTYGRSFGWGPEVQSTGEMNLFLVQNNKFGYTKDNGENFVTLVEMRTFGFAFTTKHVYVGVYDPNDYSEITLWVGTGKFTDPADYQEAMFPGTVDLPYGGYSFLDDTTGAEWLGVFNPWDDSELTSGHIITSDEAGLKFIANIKNAHHYGGYFDFDLFHGLEGIYIANTVVPGTEEDAEPTLQTRITFDNGGEWRSLAPPEETYSHNPVVCEGTCSLHIHGVSSYIQPGLEPFGYFYSSDNAIGLILATGNIGEFLQTEIAETNTYLSRDAGLTWIELLQGNYIYEFGDHGGIIVFGRVGQKTQQIAYTLDEGLSINYIQISKINFDIYIENIIAEPGGTGKRFVLYGKRADDANAHVVIGIDFTDHETNPEFKYRTCEEKDYEEWTPSDGRANNATCQLGRKVTYNRKKRDSECFNNRNFEHKATAVNCDCTVEDYECDYGYEQQTVDIDGKEKEVCVLTGNPPTVPKNCPEGTTYKVTKGYRKVAGDSCENEPKSLTPEDRKCPASGSSSDPSTTGHAVLITLVVLGVFAGLGAVGFLVHRNEQWRAKVFGALGIRVGSSRYNRLGHGALADEEFGIGGPDLDDSDVEEDAPVLQDNDIEETSSNRRLENEPAPTDQQ